MKPPILIMIRMIKIKNKILWLAKKDLEWVKHQHQKLYGQPKRMKSLLDSLKYMEINPGTDFANLCLIKQKSDALKDGFF